jgi:GTP-binding protein EngB required for normal cell division
LNINNCSNLKKIDCSNNDLKELDLSTCSKLEIVNLNNCSIEEDKIKSHLVYDTKSGKLMKNNSLAKSGPQITKVKESDIRNILIIGITGNGKSALANVLVDKSDNNQFREGNSSISKTKNFQASNIFEKDGKKYRIIDNIGFGDTNNISKEDILFKIGEGIHSAKEGINQVLFVFKDRFAPEQVMVFKMFKDFIDETEITKFTTLVRTNFVNFRKPEKCQADKDVLLDQSQELKEIINSCNGIIHVDNPTIDEEDSDNEEEMKINKNRRKESREIVLNHLVENCLEVYKLKN